MITKTLYTGTEINKVVLSGFITASKAVMSSIAIGPGGSPVFICVIRGCHGQIIIKNSF
jgi:hypothetical protein